MKLQRNQIKRTALLAAALAIFAPWVRAGDVDVKLTTTDGSTVFAVQDSANVTVASVTSNGDGTFNSVTQSGPGGNVILSTGTLQTGAGFYVTSGTLVNQLYVGQTINVGGVGINSENYTAYPMNSNGAITAKQVVSLIGSGVGTTTIASSASVVGIAVSATSGSNQVVWVAVSGIVSGVTCNAAASIGNRMCTAASAGRITSCAAKAGAGVGKMVTNCTAGGTGSVFLRPE